MRRTGLFVRSHSTGRNANGKSNGGQILEGTNFAKICLQSWCIVDLSAFADFQADGSVVRVTGIYFEKHSRPSASVQYIKYRATLQPSRDKSSMMRNNHFRFAYRIRY